MDNAMNSIRLCLLVRAWYIHVMYDARSRLCTYSRSGFAPTLYILVHVLYVFVHVLYTFALATPCRGPQDGHEYRGQTRSPRSYEHLRRPRTREYGGVSYAKGTGDAKGDGDGDNDTAVSEARTNEDRTDEINKQVLYLHDMPVTCYMLGTSAISL